MEQKIIYDETWIPDGMEENKMWNIIERIGWGKESTNKNSLGRWLCDNYSKDEIETIRTFAKIKREELKEILCNYCIHKTGEPHGLYLGGDDSFWDLRAHIVGLGKKKYYEVVKNPEIAVTMSQNYDYVENFEYIFSHALRGG